MQEKKSQKQIQISQCLNTIITEMNSHSNKFKSVSKILYQSNNNILSQLQQVKDEEIYSILNNVLNLTLQSVQYKVLISNVLALLTKIIIFIKTLLGIEKNQERKKQIIPLLSTIIDILMVSITQNKNTQQISLRILQISFSLIDQNFIRLFKLNMLTKIFSIFFQFCQEISMLQNISVSALFTLIQLLFQFAQINVCFQIINTFLQSLFQNKIFIWIKMHNNIKGLIWDLIVTSIKYFQQKHINELINQNNFEININKMYQLVTSNIFNKNSKYFYHVPILNGKNHKNNTSHNLYQEIYDFVRYFKAYVSLSSTLSIDSYKILDKQFIPFRATIPKLTLILDLQRNSRMFIFFQAICHLLLHQYDIPLTLEKGMIFMQVLAKISQQLCPLNQIKVNWQLNQNLIDRIVTQQPKITDGDYVKQIKNTIINLRIKFQKDQQLIKYRKQLKKFKQTNRIGSASQLLPENKGNAKKWQIFIKNIIRIIRCIASLNFAYDDKQQDPTRKLILQLQYWFLICPIAKSKNIVLQQLLITANVLNNKMQAIKVSQSVQIASNILYGYFQQLDSIGLTIILKMMAGIKADWQVGKSFQELDEIYNLSNAIFSQEKFITSDEVFLMVIQAIIQCSNSLIADIEQPKQKQNHNQNDQNTLKRCHKMIDYLIQRLIVVLNNNIEKLIQKWNFITAFFITLCFNKNLQIKQQGIKSIGLIIKNLLKYQFHQQINNKKQLYIINLYTELIKKSITSILLIIINQLKNFIVYFNYQQALMSGFHIIKLLASNQNNSKIVIANIHQLQQILIKQRLFRITDTNNLKIILQGIQTKSSQKNEQYRLINLLWTISDYLRKITPKDNPPDNIIQLWQILFKKIWIICQNTQQFETKQSAIHTTTQILAQIMNILPLSFIISILSKYYYEMILLLLGIKQPSLIEKQKHPQTTKVALMNYIKIFKKLINIENVNEQQKKQIIAISTKINKQINQFFQKFIKQNTLQHLTFQFIYQFCRFIDINKDDINLNQYSMKYNLSTMFQNIQNIIKLANQNHNNSKMDLKDDFFKKKLNPLIKKIIQSQKQQK